MKKKILIFGPHGQLGSDLCELLAKDYTVLAVSHEQTDVTNESAVVMAIEKAAPDFVINATAYNKVDQAEAEVGQAFALNAFAPYYMAKACKKSGAIFVHVSTDYVFDGKKNSFLESDAPNPLNAYGVSKLSGEQLVASLGIKSYIIRTSAVFGQKQSSQKLNFVDKMISLARQGSEIKVVDDLITSPTYSADLAEKIKQLIEKPAPFGIYHITNSGICSWFEFAQKIMELMSINAKLQATSSSDGKINRPKFGVLENQALKIAGLDPMPPWQDALSRYLKQKYNT